VQIRVDWTSRTIKGGMVLKSLLLERNSSPTKHILSYIARSPLRSWMAAHSRTWHAVEVQSRWSR
jgi:hypothetical protein